MADEDNPTLDQIKKFKVAELKAHLSNLGLQTTGLKVDLVARLASHYETQVHDATGREEDGQGQTQAATNDDTEGKQLENIALDSTPLLAPTENIESRGTESKVIDNDSFQKGIATTFQISDKRGSDSAIPEREHVGGAEERVNRQAVPEPGEVTQEERIPQKPWQEDSELVTMHKTEKLEEPKQAVEPVNEPSLIDTVTMDESSTMSEPVLPKESVQPVPQVEPVPQAKPVPQVEPVSQIERVPQVQPIPLAKPVSESETRHQVEPIPQVKLVPQVEPVQPAEPLSTVEPVASAKHDRMEPSAGMSRKDIEPVVEVRPYQPTVPKSTTVAAPQSQKTEMSPENDQTKSSQDQTPKASQEKPQVKPDHERNVAKPTEMDTSRVAPSKLTPSFPIKTPPAESRGGHVEVGLHRTYVPQTGESRKPTSLSAGSEMMKKVSQPGRRGDDSGYEVDQGEQEDMTSAERPQQEAGKKKKKKKKRRKKKGNDQTTVQEDTSRDEGIEVEYVPETLDVRDPVYAQFAQIFETFKLTEKPEAATKDDAKDKQSEEAVEAPKKDPNDAEMDTDSDEEEEEKQEADTGENVEKLSKKKLKLKNRMSVAELKQCVTRPDVVEMHDVTAQDPKLLVYLKACRNTVPVPRHWCFKRKFLQGKRGIIKPPFQLPEFIQKTGIMEMREALQEKEDAKNMKAKMREKVRPKMGKIDIDYQKLHDAFFKWQTKPKMTIHGDLYYEGKEFETKLKEKKPGDLSEELRTALGMPTGQGSNLVPPPWLIAMQRYGPPPSYPSLKIPGLNAPIPEGASFGYHAGGWGKPPVDEQGRPLYGDVFGVQQTDANLIDDDQVDSTLWGELESESEESEESEEESEEEAPDQTGLVTPAETGLVTPSGLTSIPAGMETPDMIELRKRKNIEEAMESGSDQPTLYTVLPEKRVGVGAMMMGSSHVYDLATAAPTGTKKTPGGLSEGVEVALDPSELELDPAAMQARYDEQLREQQNTQKEDFSDMVAEHAARQQKKRKKTADSGKAAKKYKEFKF